MSFADSLRNYSPEEEKKKRVEAAVEEAKRNIAQTAERAIKYSTTEAAKNGLHRVAGYVVSKGGYEADTIYYLSKDWRSNNTNYDNVSIYQIDQLDGHYYNVRLRPTHEYHSRSTYENHRETLKLSSKQVNDICHAVELVVQEMGFSDYLVETVPMHFYCLVYKKSIFGEKYERIDDGIGQVLKVEIRW